MTFDFSAQRLKMVDGQLRTTDVSYVPVLDAMLAIPREEFVPQARRALSYIDEDIEIAPARDGAPARYLMEPGPFAKLVQLADVSAGDFVLDVAAGTGFSSAVMAHVGASVIALESDAALAAAAQSTLSKLGFDAVAVTEGELPAGHAAEAPYDVIIIEGAVDAVPEALTDQLKDGGRLVAVIGTGNAGHAVLVRKENGILATQRAFNCAIKPLAAFRAEPAFQF